MKSDEEGKVRRRIVFREPGMVKKGKQCRRKAPPSCKRKTKIGQGNTELTCLGKLHRLTTGQRSHLVGKTCA